MTQLVMPPLMGAASVGHVDRVKALLGAGLDPNEQHPTRGRTALLYGVIAGHIGVVTALLDGGAEVDGRDFSLWTPLASAVDQGSLPIARLLIERGADVNAVKHNGQSPIMVAAATGRADLVALLERGTGDAALTGDVRVLCVTSV